MNLPLKEPQPSKGERTRTRIIEVAEALFASHGYEATTLRDIAKEVPIQQPGLYNYFETKDDLYGAVIENVFEEMLGALLAFSQQADAAQRVEELPVRALRYLADHPLSAKLLYRELLKTDDIHPFMKRWLTRLLEAATGPVGELPVSRRERLVVVITMYSAVTGFFAIGPTLASLMGEELDFDADGPLHLELLQRYARATIDGGDS
jgi:TetR/AcrR family transcriptional regulator